MSVLFDLQSCDGFTEAEVAIARYVLDHLTMIPSTSISTLAKATCTSNATIVRLCKKLGTKGYSDFKLQVARETDRLPTDAPEEVDVDFPVYNKSSPIAVMRAIADLHHFAADSCFTAVSALDLQSAARLIAHARVIYLYSMGESDLAAQILSYRLTRIGKIPVHVGNYQESLAMSANVSPHDVALFVSYSGDSILRYRKDIDLLRKRGCPLAIITSRKRVKGFDVVVRYPHAETEGENEATFYSTQATMYLLDALFGIVYAMDYEHAHPFKQDIERRMRDRTS